MAGRPQSNYQSLAAPEPVLGGQSFVGASHMSGSSHYGAKRSGFGSRAHGSQAQFAESTEKMREIAKVYLGDPRSKADRHDCEPGHVRADMLPRSLYGNSQFFATQNVSGGASPRDPGAMYNADLGHGGEYEEQLTETREDLSQANLLGSQKIDIGQMFDGLQQPHDK